jgi:predicted HTH domain antitoxin
MKWDIEYVIEYYDSHWNITLGQLSKLSGYTVKELKHVLMG